MIVRLEPSATDFETFLIACIGFAREPMPFILVHENLHRCDSPTLVTFITKSAKITQSGVSLDKQYTLTDGRTTCHFDNLSVLAFPFTFLFLHGTSGLFLDHAFDVVIMRLQTDIAEVRIYPLLVIGREFGNDIDFGVADITHVFGSPAVMSLA